MARKRPGNRLTEVIILAAFGLTILFLVSSFMRVQPEEERSDIRPESITVEVLNGCGESGVAGQVRQLLQDAGFDVVRVDNAEVFTYPITLVKDRRGNPETACLIAQALGDPGIILALDQDRLLDVTVIVGRDYRQILYPRKRDWSDRIVHFFRRD